MLDITRSVRRSLSFKVTTDFNSISGTTETPYLLLKNPSSNTYDILITHNVFGTDSASIRSIFRFYFDPTITANGTPLAPISTYSGGSSPVMETYRSPTVSASGTRLSTVILPANTPSKGLNRFCVLPPGGAYLVTIQNSISNGQSIADVFWLEEF